MRTKKAIIFSLILMTGVFQAMSQTDIQASQTVNQLIPDGSPTGLSSSIILSGYDTTVANITVNLDITGTWNGDLYAYLQSGSGFAVLLNRVGSTPTDIYGYGDSGMNVTFSDSAANGNIHYYQLVAVPPTGDQLTGTWSPDGRNVSPYSVTGTETPTASLSSFNGLNIDGKWTLFVADVSGGNLNTLTSWQVDITPAPAPEPTSLCYMVAGGGLFLALLLRRKVTVK